MHVVEVNIPACSACGCAALCGTLLVHELYHDTHPSVQLGLRALKKAGREHSMRRFVQDAVGAMPALASEFKSVARNRFHVDLDVAIQPSQKHFQDFLTSEDNEDGRA